MAEALVSIILEQLASIACQQIQQEVKFVVRVDDKIRKFTSNIRAIRAVLDDAEKKQVKDDAVRDWLDKLKDVFYDIDDVLDEWNTSIGKLQIKEVENASKPIIGKVCSLTSCYQYCFRQVVWRRDIAIKIKDLNKRLDVIVSEKNMFGLKEGIVEPKRPMTTSVIDISMVHGRDVEKNTLLTKLLNENSQALTISIISIVGIGGIGKTTLARIAFNDDRVKTHFQERIWVCVSKPFDEIRVAKAILESLGGDVSKLVELETVLLHVRESLEGKNFLLVLDDVWTEEPKDWEQLIDSLKNGSQGSIIIVTTRNMNVANIIGTSTANIFLLGTLLEDESWSLFSQVALSGRTIEDCKNFENIGRKIVGKCKGLPLAIKTLASLLRFKTKINEWENVLDSGMWELQEVEKGIFPPLLLSYYDLPSALKKCFSYCAIFPKDYKIKKDYLIKSWMSQSYLKEERNKDMELIGKEYFENLASRSFFQDFEKNNFSSSIESCKMHDIVHDFAQFLTKKECFNIEIDDCGKFQEELSNKRARHIRLQFRDEESLFMCINNHRNLRSLVVEYKGTSVSSVTSSKLIGNFTYLRELDLRRHGIEELPREIENLIHLRYLDLSKNYELKELPDALCKLYNLQTLNLNDCKKLVKLPQVMGKLINLRHLMIGYTLSLSYMPKGIEGLSCLRTLSDLKLSSSGKACGVECLENLNNLRGSLWIWGLDQVTDVDKAKRANLQNKKNLLSLCLRFKMLREDRRMNENEEIVLQVLEPPSNLVELYIIWYGGKAKWPDWMVSLSQLRRLQLSNCRKCEYLPPLGKLSSLEYLEIRLMNSVKRVSNEFLGVESDGTATSTIFFPKLKTLWFDLMEEWEEWEEWHITRRRDEVITIMPCLQFLTIEACKKLKALPDSVIQRPTLKQLEIRGSSVLEACYKKETGKDWAKISHIPNISIGL